MYNMFSVSKFNGDISDWDFSGLKHDINLIGTKIKIKKKEWDIIKVDKIDIDCDVLLMEIEKKYIRCSTCNKTFDISIKSEWIDKKRNCPHCTHKWKNNVIYVFNKTKKLDKIKHLGKLLGLNFLTKQKIK